jgi:hypothetical protein
MKQAGLCSFATSRSVRVRRRRPAKPGPIVREATGVWTGTLSSGLWQEILVAEADLDNARELLATNPS